MASTELRLSFAVIKNKGLFSDYYLNKEFIKKQCDNSSIPWQC